MNGKRLLPHGENSFMEIIGREMDKGGGEILVWGELVCIGQLEMRDEKSQL